MLRVLVKNLSEATNVCDKQSPALHVQIEARGAFTHVIEKDFSAEVLSCHPSTPSTILRRQSCGTPRMYRASYQEMEPRVCLGRHSLVRVRAEWEVWQKATTYPSA